MSERAIPRMTVEAFLDWGLTQDRRYELVDGVPMAMTGARQRHDLIVMNVQAGLHPRLRGTKCRNFSADIAVKIPAGNVRRPDAGIDCGPFNENDTAATEPFLVLEVLSRSTRVIDMVIKLEEYKTVPTLNHIVLIDPGRIEVIHWSRQDGGAWRYVELDQPDALIAMPEISCALDLASVYEGLTLGPRLVSEDDLAR